MKIHYNIERKNLKLLLLILLLILCNYSIYGSLQNIEISFIGTGAAKKIDSVFARNLSTNNEIALPGKGTLILKNISNVIPKESTGYELDYKSGDIILYRCESGEYTTIVTETPSKSKKMVIEFMPCKDYEGNNYAVVKIGSQIWMAENLRTKKYNNGDPIATTATTTQDISKETSPKYQWIYNDDEKFLATYGRLYTWDVVIDNRGISPKGWHVPSKEEFKTLIDYLGGTDSAGIKLKVTGNSHWNFHQNSIRTNSSGFSAVPGGLRTNIAEKEYDGLGIGNYFWTTTPDNFPIHIGMFYDNPNAFISSAFHPNFNGFSVRCVKN